MKAVFRLPFSVEFLIFNNQNSGKNLVNFTSFTQDKSIDFLVEDFKIFSENQLEKKFFEVENFPEILENIPIPNHKEYISKLEKTIETISENNLQKLVISRTISKEISSLNLFETYKNLCKKYQNTLCYLLISDEEIWLGATPEILGKFNKKSGEFFTMSLAGTLPTSEEWGKKEIEEQKPVTEYISKILQNYCKEVEKSETYNHISGDIKHLRTDFTAEINAEYLENLIAELHPTPAVCGIPKEFCKEKILEIENYNREFYTGYIKIETEEEIFYFVNLRCAKIFKNRVVAFAGGGITALSSPEKEWQETELKSQAILGNLVF